MTPTTARTVLILMMPAAAFADANVAMTAAGNFTIAGNEETCMLVHKLADGFEETSLLVNDSSQAPGKSVRVDIGADASGTVNRVLINNGSADFESLTLYDRLRMDAEAAFETVSDERYFEMLDEADEAEGLDDPGFASFAASVDGVAFSEYAQSVRTNERFPTPRIATIEVGLDGVAISEPGADIEYQYASVSYQGICSVVFSSE